MRCLFEYGLKDIAAASFLSCLIAAAVGVLTSPPATDAGVILVSVNRATKGDRLLKNKQSKQNTLSPKKSRLIGCEPTFSPIAEPTWAYMLNQCIA